MGATPLGAETFGWELFVEEKLSMVLIQSLPTPETFESFVSLLGQGKGMVYVQPPNIVNQDETGNVIFNSENDSFDHTELFHDLANKVKGAVASAKFDCQLTCSNQFSTYEGVWASCKEDQIMFKKDLRFLLTLLSEGKLEPQVEERVCLEDVPGVQDRIELEGKQGTIVCLPTTLFEKKANMVATVSKQKGKNGSGSTDRSISSKTSSPVMNDSYAIDSGYCRPNHDSLSDFNFLTPKPQLEDESVTGSFLDQAASFTFAQAAKNGDAFLSFGNSSFATWDGEGDYKPSKRDEVAVPVPEEMDVVDDILQQQAAKEDEKKEEVEKKEETKVKEEDGVKDDNKEKVGKEQAQDEDATALLDVSEEAKTVKTEERPVANLLNRRAQAALQRKKDTRARLRKAQQEEAKASSVEKKVDEEVEAETEEANVAVDDSANQSAQTSLSRRSISPRRSRREAREESLSKTFNSTPPVWKKEASANNNKSSKSYTRPTGRNFQPTPEWLKGVRPPSRAETKHAEYVPSKYRFGEPPVKTVSINHTVDGRDDDDVSAASDFNSVMSKWKAVEKRKA